MQNSFYFFHEVLNRKKQTLSQTKIRNSSLSFCRSVFFEKKNNFETLTSFKFSFFSNVFYFSINVKIRFKKYFNIPKNSILPMQQEPNYKEQCVECFHKLSQDLTTLTFFLQVLNICFTHTSFLNKKNVSV